MESGNMVRWNHPAIFLHDSETLPHTMNVKMRKCTEAPRVGASFTPQCDPGSCHPAPFVPVRVG